MKKLLLALTIMVSFTAQADEFIQYDNGATAWRNDAGVVYGYSGGMVTGESGFNDVKTGQRYEYIGGNSAVNTGNSQPIYTPDYSNPAGVVDYGKN